MPEWRNWQTHTTQNRAGNHVGSSPTLGTRNKSTDKVCAFYFCIITSGARKGVVCVLGQSRLDQNADKKCPVDIFYDAACRVPLWAPITNLFELQIQKSISKMVDFFVCEKIYILFQSVLPRRVPEF